MEFHGVDVNTQFKRMRELAQDRFIIGDPDDCIRELTRHVDALGVNCVILRIQWPGMEQAKVLRTIKLLAERVMPALGH